MKLWGLLIYVLAVGLLSMESDPRPVVALRDQMKVRDDKTFVSQAVAAGKITVTKTNTPPPTVTPKATSTPKVAVTGTVTATATSTVVTKP